MRCPRCGENKDRVLQSREIHDGTELRRRRHCNACSFRYTTYETETKVPILNRKMDGIITAQKKIKKYMDDMDKIFQQGENDR